MCQLTRQGESFHNAYMYQISMMYTLNTLQVRQLYLNYYLQRNILKL